MSESVTHCKTESDLIAHAGKFASAVPPGETICLAGGLGAGKTSWARGFIRALAGPCEVPSPTFTLVQTYETPAAMIWHLDLYRIEDEREIFELGVLDVLGDAICLIEWPQRMGSLMPDTHTLIQIDFADIGRTIRVSRAGADQ